MRSSNASTRSTQNRRRVGLATLAGAIAAVIAIPASAAGAASAASAADTDGPVEAGIFVNKVENLSPDFVNGVDVSSVLSEEASGVVYRDAEGNPQDIFETLHDNGVNTVRVRVWNDPYDADGNGYGGGTVDVPRAVEIGERATAAGMRVLVDFHYSDFWADPGRQLAPKAWQGLTPADTVTALHDFTADALEAFKAADVDVSMVQIGNETNNAIAGYTRAGTAIDQQFAALLQAGSDSDPGDAPRRPRRRALHQPRDPGPLRHLRRGPGAVRRRLRRLRQLLLPLLARHPGEPHLRAQPDRHHLRQEGHGGRDVMGAHPRRRRRIRQLHRIGHHHRRLPRQRAGPGHRAARRHRSGRRGRRRRHRRLLLGARVDPGRPAERARDQQGALGARRIRLGNQLREGLRPRERRRLLRRILVGQPGPLRLRRHRARVAPHLRVRAHRRRRPARDRRPSRRSRSR